MPESVDSDPISEYKEARKKAWRELFKGLIFLVICLLLWQFTQDNQFLFSNLIAGSASIVGWVAMWRPIETFLYDLPEMRRNLKKST